MEKAVVYARYSSHNQTENSIEGQLAAAHAYAESHGYTIIQEYCDRAKTGTNDQREAFQQMLADTKHHKFTVIIVWKVDRFGRNREEITFNKHKCKKEGVRVEYVAEQLGEGNESVILESVLEGMAEYYSKQLSTNVKRGLKAAKDKGHWVGGSPRLGFKLVDKRLVVNEDEVPIVQTIFEQYAKGATMPEISELTGETIARVSNVLHDPKYIGENQGTRMISDDLWNAVQGRLNSNVKRRKTKEEREQIYILTTKLVCACGSHMVGHSAGYGKGRHAYGYYSCASARRGAGCHMRYINRHDAEEVVLGAIRAIVTDPEAIDKQVEGVWSKYQAMKPSGDTRRALESLRTTEKAIENITKAVEQGMDYRLVKDRLETLQSQREIELEEVRKCKTGIRNRMSKEMFRVYLDGGKTITDDKQMIDYYVQSIVWNGEEYKIALNICSDVRLNSRIPGVLRIKAK